MRSKEIVATVKARTLDGNLRWKYIKNMYGDICRGEDDQVVIFCQRECFSIVHKNPSFKDSPNIPSVDIWNLLEDIGIVC